MPSGPKDNPRVVVIGGGLTGCSAALHLNERGVSDVTLIERGALGDGATARSFGFLGASVAAELQGGLAASGLDLGWRPQGRVIYASSDERWDSLRRVPERSHALGVRVESLTAAEVAARLPLIDPAGLVGGLWIPGDGILDAKRAAAALGRQARAGGVTIRENLRVTAIRSDGGAISGVVTAEGEIACDAVVVTAGAESADLVHDCGVNLPLFPAERSYIASLHFGVPSDLPLFTSYDDRLFGREQAGGLVLGGFDGDMSGCLEAARRRFPGLRAMRLERSDPVIEGFTPDGELLVGPVPGVTGLYTACGCAADGPALAAGRLLAEWIADGAPGTDAAAFDVRRFSAVQATAGYLRERVTEIPALPCRIAAVGEDFHTARNLFRSPLHDRLAEAGARFTPVTAWERAAWLRHGSDDASWTHSVAKETHAATTGVLAVDRSADTKILLRGPGAVAWFDALAPAWVNEGTASQDRVHLRPLPSAAGYIDAMVRVFVRGPDWCVVSTTPDQETRLSEWLRRAGVPRAIQVHHQTFAYARIELYGSRRAELIHALSNSNLARHREAGDTKHWTGGARFHVRHDAFNDSSMLSMPTPSATFVWDRLLDSGRDFDLSIGGHLAEEALRIGRGIPLLGREISCATSVGELLATASPHRRPAGASGRPARTFGAFSSPYPTFEFGGGDPILAGDRCIGRLTSRLRLPVWPSALALGWLDFSQWHGERLEWVGGGGRWPLEPRETPWEISQRTL